MGFYPSLISVLFVTKVLTGRLHCRDRALFGPQHSRIPNVSASMAIVRMIIYLHFRLKFFKDGVTDSYSGSRSVEALKDFVQSKAAKVNTTVHPSGVVMRACRMFPCPRLSPRHLSMGRPWQRRGSMWPPMPPLPRPSSRASASSSFMRRGADTARHWPLSMTRYLHAGWLPWHWLSMIIIDLPFKYMLFVCQL